MRSALYGSQTKMAVKNFPVSGWTMPAAFIRALALVKEHAAIVNGQLGEIPEGHARAIARAAASVASGRHLDQFPVDVFQTGSGTSTNMNMNEVIAALGNMGNKGIRGNKRNKRNKGGKSMAIHPNDHINRCQSSNDVIPTALQIACALTVRDDLIPALGKLRGALREKAQEFHSVIKTGRTHHMDAVPVRLGDEFRSYATLLAQAVKRVRDASVLLRDLPLGGTAAGTGLNAHPQFAKGVIERLARETKLPLRETKDHIAAQSFPFAVQALSGALREAAVVLHKIANDIRLMASGPVAGFNELTLPPLQPGSSIMPGKANPVIPESVVQVCAQVIGADVTVGVWCAQGGVFELNTCMPLMAHSLLTSMRLLANACRVFADKCVAGIGANADVMTDRLARSAMLATALVPHIGYDAAAKIAREAQRTGETIMEVALRRTRLSKKELASILDPRTMA